MKVDQQNSRGRFFVKQAILLIITVILLIFFTVPLLKAIKGALNPGELEATVNRGKQEAASLETKLETTESRMLMGAGDDEAQGNLKKEVEELKRQIALKELDNKHLQEQMALVQTMLEVMKAKSAPAPAPSGPGTVHPMAEILTKIFGCIGSMLTGGMALFAWWRRRREVPQNAES
jgi:hypothetical protein